LTNRKKGYIIGVVLSMIELHLKNLKNFFKKERGEKNESN